MFAFGWRLEGSHLRSSDVLSRPESGSSVNALFQSWYIHAYSWLLFLITAIKANSDRHNAPFNGLLSPSTEHTVKWRPRVLEERVVEVSILCAIEDESELSLAEHSPDELSALVAQSACKHCVNIV